MATLRFKDVDIRYVSDEGKIWFCWKDVCSALDYPTRTFTSISSTNKKSLIVHGDGISDCIDELGLFKLVLASKKPKARDFKHFIEVSLNTLKYAAFQSHEETVRNLQDINHDLKEALHRARRGLTIIKQAQIRQRSSQPSSVSRALSERYLSG